tara:strand:+ start:520 stop:1239 length:720 start_codon:yes stop_codon:yes gene_type:complete
MSDRFNLGSFIESAAYAALDEIFAEFRSDDGFARPSRYEVFFFPPVSRSQTNIFAQVMGQTVADQTARKTALRCESFEFPGRNLDSAPDTNIYGPEREIVQGYSYGDVTAVFQCSSDMKEKRFFETWQRLAYNPQTWSMQYYNDYTGSIKIFQLDETDRQRYGVELVECFPKTVAAQPIAYASVNEIQKVSVTFAYRYWKDLVDEADLPKPLTQRVAEAVLNTVESNIVSQIPKVLRKL